MSVSWESSSATRASKLRYPSAAKDRRHGQFAGGEIAAGGS